MYKDFWHIYVKMYGRLPILLVICIVTIAGALLEGINIGLLVPLLETLGPQQPGEMHWISGTLSNLFNYLGLPFRLETIMLVLLVLLLSIAGLKYLGTALTLRTSQGFTVWIKSSIMRNLLQADLSFFHRQRLGVLTDTLATQAGRAGSCLNQITGMVSLTGVALAFLIAAFLVAPVLTLAAIGMIGIITLAMQYYIAKAKVIGANQINRENELQATAIESLSGIHVIKSFVLEPLKWMDFTSKAELAAEVNYQLEINQSRMRVLQEIALFAMVGGIVYLGIVFLGLSIAVIVTLLFILYRLMPRIIAINSTRQALAASLVTLHRVKTIMDETAESTVISGEKPFLQLKLGIELQGVSFSYNSSVDVLRDTSFSMEQGKMTAIVGASGAGKSTLIDLILRYYDPNQGSILVDGINLKELDLVSWRKAIGVVSQDVFLFNESVTNNIALGRPEATSAAIAAAAKQAYAHDFIQQLPQGYETLIGDRGWNLSGGQRQRIALARAILNKPKILILDEATSSLDSESERLIQEYVKSIRGTCTLVVVAHRMSSIREADKIIVLQDGKIIEEGDLGSLLAEAGVFANYHYLQAGS